MTDEPSPRPWKIDTFAGDYEIRDAISRLIARPCGKNAEERFNVASFIVAAVNERDRLRDIVRRLVDLFTPGTIHPAGTMERLLREARAAIGEDKA